MLTCKSIIDAILGPDDLLLEVSGKEQRELVRKAIPVLLVQVDIETILLCQLHYFVFGFGNVVNHVWRNLVIGSTCSENPVL
jgi:hypothetical protein